MTARGHKRTGPECRTKTKSLRLEYKREVGHNSKSGCGKVTCPFYEELYGILGLDANVQPKTIIQSLILETARTNVVPPPENDFTLEHFTLGLEAVEEEQLEADQHDEGTGKI
ncbi:UNVERIFIED_CONTAM: hypothetical protein K2H54_048062 [Gekko kuhli]